MKNYFAIDCIHDLGRYDNRVTNYYYCLFFDLNLHFYYHITPSCCSWPFM